MQPADWFRVKNKFLPLPYSVFIKSKSGFTLIEMLVVMAIIGILTGGAITAYNNFNQGQTVRRAALDLVTDIRETQNRAVSGLKDVDCRVDDYDASLPGAGQDNIDDYQLDGHYLVFSVGASSYQRQQSCSEDAGSGQVVAPSPTSIEIPPDLEGVINLVGNTSVYIDSVDIVGCPPLTELTVNFLPLRGVEFFDGVGLEWPTSTPANSSCQSADVVISDGTTNFTITVDLSGQVSQTSP